MDEGADKIRFEVSALRACRFLCHQASAIASAINTPIRVHSLANPRDLIRVTGTFLSYDMLFTHLAESTRNPADSLLEPGSGLLGLLGSVDEMS